MHAMNGKRRGFLKKAGAASLSLLFFGGCIRQKEEPTGNDTAGDPATSATGMEGYREALEKNRQLPLDLVRKQLDMKVNAHMQRTHHCAQSSFLALRDQFQLPGGQVVKALTPLPGIAERGLTCGAVTGPLMALGLVFGRGEGRLEDWEAYQRSLVPAGRFCDLFEQEYGTLDCHGVQKEQFGRCYRLTDPDELRQFQADGATDHCSEVVRNAVRMAATIILEEG